MIHTGIIIKHKLGQINSITKGACYVGELPVYTAMCPDAEILRDYINSNNLKLGANYYQTWIEGEQVSIGQKRTFNHTIYECVQAHTTQADWTPDVTPALWRLFEEGIPEWRQPQGAHDVYPLNFIVRFNDKLYISRHETNSWQPDQVGTDIWEEIKDGDDDEIPEWVQPKGTVGLYHKGDKVIYDGWIWESTADNNSWKPGVYGWVKVEEI